ncbi:unnamed protein product [Rhodiola kirilowii]
MGAEYSSINVPKIEPLNKCHLLYNDSYIHPADQSRSQQHIVLRGRT